MKKTAKKILEKILHILWCKVTPSYYKAYHYNIDKNNYPCIGSEVQLGSPIYGIIPETVKIESFARVQSGVRFIMNEKQGVLIKKYSAIGSNSIIVPGAHTPTVGIPQYLSNLHINDINSILTINEDVWIGAGCTILSKGTMGRGAIAAANSVVIKPVPPYAVVSGIPAKIIAVRFSIEQIIAHEEILYPESERLSREFLTDLFENNYKGLKTIGTEEISEEDVSLLIAVKKSRGIITYN